MNKLHHYLISAGIATLIRLLGFGIGEAIQQKEISLLEKELWKVQTEKKYLSETNYQLHIDLINRDNPYKWELWGGSLGEWGYRKPDESSILGTVGDGYVYLTK